MVAKKYIDKSIPQLKNSDSLEEVLNMMEDHDFAQLPVVEDFHYYGIVSKEILEMHPSVHGKTLADITLLHDTLVIKENYHLYELARVASELNLEILPVFDAENQFKGMLSVKEVAVDFISKFAAQPIGAIVVLQMKVIDFSLAEISRLVESNEAKIISMFTETDSINTSLLEVTIKVNTIDLTRIVATFERFEFKVLGTFHDYETQKFESNRIDLLLRYLEI
jgi:CBS domain-containing protein